MSLRFRLTWAASLVSIALVVLIGAAAVGRPAYAAAAATYTVTARSAYLRDTPVSGAPATYSVFMGQTYPITGRTADSAWVRLDMAGANKGTWILATFGTIAGTLNAVAAIDADTVAAEGADPISAAPTAAAAAGGDTASVSNQRLTISAASAYARGAPASTATRVASLFRGQTFTVTGRDPSSQWLQVLLPGEAWVSVGVGTLSGHMSALPIIGAPPVVAGQPDAPAPTEELGALPAWIPVLTPHMRDVYARAGQHGLNRAIFSVAGDCNSEANIYAELIAYDLMDLTNHPYLRPTARYFKAATFHKSYAVAGGFNAASIMDPVWSDPQFCQRGESPFACELRTTKSSVVFIQLGTGDQFQWEDFETNYRVPIEYALNAGVLPVLVTKVDTLESIEGGAPEGYINNVIRRLGTEYNVPVVDLWQATRGLRNGGLTDEPGHDFHLNAEAIGVHVISTLQMLHRLLNG